MAIPHSQKYVALIAEVRKRIEEITPQQTKKMMDQNLDFELVDVREIDEWNKAHIPGARHLSRGIIEREIERKIPDLNKEIVLYCVRGYRSLLVAENLQRMGYRKVKSMKGGLHCWIKAGLEMKI